MMTSPPDGRRAIVVVMKRQNRRARVALDQGTTGTAEACAAAFRKQSRHRQSSPSSGIGSRAVSSAHQHGPARLQVNSVPHREQARRREAGISNRFVINPAEKWLEFFMPGSCRTAVYSAPIYA
jgi:hypothetical protein